MDILVKVGLPAVSFRPMSMVLASGGEMDNSFFGSLEVAFNQGLIPVVYGDVIWDKKWKSTRTRKTRSIFFSPSRCSPI